MAIALNEHDQWYEHVLYTFLHTYVGYSHILTTGTNMDMMGSDT